MAKKRSRKRADLVTVDLGVADAILNRCQALSSVLNAELKAQATIGYENAEAFAALLDEQLGRLQGLLYGDLEAA